MPRALLPRPALAGAVAILSILVAGSAASQTGSVGAITVTAPDSVPRGSPISVTIHASNTAGTAPMPARPASIVFCRLHRTPFKDPKKGWTVLPGFSECAQASPSGVGLPEVPAGQTKDVPVSGLSAPVMCPAALVVKHAQGPNNFGDPAIASYAVLHPTGIFVRGNPKLEGTPSIARRGAHREVALAYRVSIDIAPSFADTVLVVETCKNDRCFVRHQESIPASAFQYSKHREGNRWVNAHVATGTLKAQFDVAASEYYNDRNPAVKVLPDTLRVSLGARLADNNDVIDKGCDGATVKYASL